MVRNSCLKTRTEEGESALDAGPLGGGTIGASS